MNRRDFSVQLTGLGLGCAALGSPLLAHAQGGPVEGRDYVRLNQPAPVSAAPGKIDVVEFFWYGCPHCNAFEPALEAWVKKLPANVAFRRSPVAFREMPHSLHQRIYFALESMGKLGTMHRKVFYAMHVEHQRLDKPDEIAAFMAKNGVDGPKFLEVFNSFSVQTKARQATQLSEAYKIDGVPAIGVAGRFYTSGQLAGSPERSLLVTDQLIQRVAKG